MALSMLDEKRFEGQLGTLLHDEVDIAQWAEDSFRNEEFRLLFIKVLANLVCDQDVREHWDEASILMDERKAKDILYSVLTSAVKVARQGEAVNPVYGRRIEKDYSTGELAKYFEVTITTINNWIRDKRFEGVERTEANKQLRLKESTWFNSPSGARYQIKDVVKAWEEDQKEWNSPKKGSDEEMIKSYIAHFEQKYGGDYALTLGKKHWDELTAEEETDASMWTFFLQRYQNGVRA